jgi:hypothetical protein
MGISSEPNGNQQLSFGINILIVLIMGIQQPLRGLEKHLVFVVGKKVSYNNPDTIYWDSTKYQMMT